MNTGLWLDMNDPGIIIMPGMEVGQDQGNNAAKVILSN